MVKEMALVGRDGENSKARKAVYFADNNLKQRVFRYLVACSFDSSFLTLYSIHTLVKIVDV